VIDVEKYERILRAVCAFPWAILPERLDAIIEVLDLRLRGEIPDAEAMAARIVAAKAVGQSSGTSPQAVAVIPVLGTIAQRADLFTEISGGTSTQRLTRQIDDAIATPQVGTILLDIDSPGGSVFGIQELADHLFEARGSKRIVASVNSLSASAAYWLSASADEIVVTPGGQVGSIGVYTLHWDQRQAVEQKGFKPTLISAGKHKVEGHPLAGPLQDDARASIQERIDGYYDAFVESVARGRNVRTEAVRSGFGEGRVVSAKRAVELGMADRVATFDQVLRELVGKDPAGKPPRAEATSLELERARLDFLSA
jgi:signal peptide peptidase SppA